MQVYGTNSEIKTEDNSLSYLHEQCLKYVLVLMEQFNKLLLYSLYYNHYNIYIYYIIASIFYILILLLQFNGEYSKYMYSAFTF